MILFKLNKPHLALIFLATLVLAPRLAGASDQMQNSPMPSNQQNYSSDIFGSLSSAAIAVAKIRASCVENLMPRESAKATRRYQDWLQSAANSPNGIHAPSEYAWIALIQGDNYNEKVESIYENAAKYDIPPAILAGSILQESSGADLGLGRDFDNWTCGPSQFSVIGWCQWANSLSRSEQDAIGWPRDAINAFKNSHGRVDICQENSFIARESVKPMYDIAMARMKKKIHTSQPYILDASYMISPRPVEFADLQEDLAKISAAHNLQYAGDAQAEKLRFQIIKSFSENCSDHKLAFQTMAFMLNDIYKSLPREIQRAQMLPGIMEGEANPLYNCNHQVTTKGFPLQLGWLLADAVYNAGPGLMPGIQQYQKENHIPWDNFGPKELDAAIQYAIDPKRGMWGIGPQEAKGHIHDLIELILAK